MDAIEVVDQVGQGALEYDPLVHVKGLPCWPHLPAWDQNLPRPRRPTERASRPSSTRSAAGNTGLSRSTCGNDFDEVVLAIPVGALRADRRRADVRQRGIRRDGQRARRPCRRRPSSSGRGAGRGARLTRYGPDSVAATFVEPLDTWCDMDQVMGAECWRPQDGVRGIAYVCGVLEDTPARPSAGDARVKANATRVRRAATSATSGPRRTTTRGPSSGRSRRGAQARNGSTRSTGAPTPHPGSATSSLRRATRPRAWRRTSSGFANLVLAGDWTRQRAQRRLRRGGRDLGHAGGARGSEHRSRDRRGGPRWLTPGRELSSAAAVRGVRAAVAPTRARSSAATGSMRMLLLACGRRADRGPRPAHAHTARRRARSSIGAGEPRDAAVRPQHRRLGNPAVGRSTDRSRSCWHRSGSPYWAGHERNGRFEAKRLCMAVPHILVDNPMSHVGGREIYGFPKALGRFESAGETLRVEGLRRELLPGRLRLLAPVDRDRARRRGRGGAGRAARRGSRAGGGPGGAADRRLCGRGRGPARRRPARRGAVPRCARRQRALGLPEAVPRRGPARPGAAIRAWSRRPPRPGT